jgi:hypothetical protein
MLAGAAPQLQVCLLQRLNLRPCPSLAGTWLLLETAAETAWPPCWLLHLCCTRILLPCHHIDLVSHKHG